MDYVKVVKEQRHICDKVCNIFTAYELSSEEGELILLWLAGLSLGKRQASLTEETGPLAVLALGWAVGAEDGDDD